MHGRTLNALLGYGLGSELISKIDQKRHTVGELRAIIPMVHVAIEQIAGFEQPTSVEEALTACRSADRGNSVPEHCQKLMRIAVC